MSNIYNKARYDKPGVQPDLFTSTYAPTHFKVRWQYVKHSDDGKINYENGYDERLYPKRGTARSQYTRIKNLSFYDPVLGKTISSYIVEFIPCTLIEHESIDPYEKGK